jgi:hypothetical protein
LLLIELMALTRIARASLYISRRLHPVAAALSGPHRVLEFEHSPRNELLELVSGATEIPDGAGDSGKKGNQRAETFGDKVLMLFFSSTPLILGVIIAAAALAAFGIAVDPGLLTIGFGAPAIVLAGALGLRGIRFSLAHERRKGEEPALMRLLWKRPLPRVPRPRIPRNKRQIAMCREALDVATAA